MKLKLLTLIFLIASVSYGQTFTWDNATISSFGSFPFARVSENVSGVNCTIRAENNTRLVLGPQGGGTTGNSVLNADDDSDIFIRFTPAVDIQTIVAYNVDGSSGNTSVQYEFISVNSAAGNSTVTANIQGKSNPTTIMLNWTDVTEIEVRKITTGGNNTVGIDDIAFLLPGSTIYVDKDATGNNDGTSWADAYTSLQPAIDNLNDNDEVWIAEGVYNPVNRTSPFIINNTGIKFYGGFDGTESAITDRVFGTNETIISADLSNDDGAVRPPTNFIFSPSNKSDNAANLFFLNNFSATVPTVFDGLSLTHAFNGPGIFVNEGNFVPNLEVRNCAFRFNASQRGGGISVNGISNNSTTEIAKFIIDQCVFEKNAAFRGAGFYLQSRNSNAGGIGDQQVEVSISNSLFFENRTSEDINDFPSLPYEGSAFYILRQSDSFAFTTKVTNCTFSKNEEQGEFTTTVSANSTNSSNMVEFGNNIFWDNLANAGTAKAFRSNLSSPSISHCIDEDDFSNIPSALKNNISTADPLFDDPINDDFRLQSTSPAVDSGDNTTVIGNVDLLNNQRIFNTTVDMGAFEFDASALSVDDFSQTQNDIKLYPNPVVHTLNIETIHSIQQIELYSVTGQRIKLLKGTNTINVSNLKDGIYFAKIFTDRGNVTKRFIKE